MARCVNLNLDEVKAISKALKSDIDANFAITEWQDATGRLEEIPTVEEVRRFINDRKVLFELEKQTTIQSIYNNLESRGLIVNIKGAYYIPRTNAQTVIERQVQLADVVDAKTGVTQTMKDNMTEIMNYLHYYNVPRSSFFSYTKSNKGNLFVKFTINEESLKGKDVIEEARGLNTPKSIKIVEHMMKLFPQLKIERGTAEELKKLYDKLPKYSKKKVDFEDINAFQYQDTVYLINERVTDDTIIEEMLHPFVTALRSQNPELANNLYEEAKVNFPELAESIEEAYAKKGKGFTTLDRENELVTQALTRHFRQEYENEPTKRFLNRVRDFIAFFADILRSIYQALNRRGSFNPNLEQGLNIVESQVGDEQIIFPDEILRQVPKTATLTSMAMILNSEGIGFRIYELEPNQSKASARPTVKYSLTPRKQAALDKIISNDIGGVQKEILDQLFHTALINIKESDFFSATNKFGNRNLLVYDSKAREYKDLLADGKSYTAIEEKIKGLTRFQEDLMEDDLRKDFITLTEAIAQQEKIEDVIPKMKVMTNEQATNAFIRLNENINDIVRGENGSTRSIIVPQVVVYDVGTSTATTIDLLAIDIHGRMSIINLATHDFAKSDPKYDEPVELADDSQLPKGNPISRRELDNIKVNTARRMLENMGYDTVLDEQSAMTFHINMNVEEGTYSYDGLQKHSPQDNLPYVDALVPSTLIETKNDKEYKESVEDQEDILVDFDDIFTEEDAKAETRAGEDFIDPDVAFNVVTGALQAYKKGLIKKQEALDVLRKKVFISKSVDKTKEDINNALSQINIALGSGAKERNKIYSDLLFKAVAEIKKFKKFVTDPKNVSDPDYITYVLNAKRYLKTYEGLYVVLDSGSLNATQTALILQLRTLLTELTGEGDKQGIIRDAIEDFVKLTIKEKSNYNFTEEELNAIINLGGKPSDFIKGEMKGRDIDILEYGTKDMATSPDTLLAIADKMFKAKVIEKNELVKDIIDKNNKLAARLLRLSDTNDKQKLFEFMIEYDENGVPTGQYVKKIGRRHDEMLNKLNADLKDENGNWKQFIETPNNIEDANKADLDHNIKLAIAKAKYADFLRAEDMDPTGRPIDGEFYKYTDEFKEARRQHERFVSDGTYGYWIRDEKKVTKREYDRYKAKYYDSPGQAKLYAEKDNFGNYTGMTAKSTRPGSYVQKRYVEPRAQSRSGQEMRSEKYLAMEQDTSELGRARFDYYKFYDRQYTALLNMLPPQQRQQMVGELARIKSNFLNDLSNKDGTVIKTFAKVKKNVSDFFTTSVQNRAVYTDEEGKMQDSLPVLYTGKLVEQQELDRLNAEIIALKKSRQKQEITIEEYDTKLQELKGTLRRLEAKPTRGELNLDLATSLSTFSEMAINYHTLSNIEDALLAIKEVVETREYQPADPLISLGKYNSKGIFEKIGKKERGESLTAKRFNKWLHMSYYDDESITKGFVEKAGELIIQYSSLSYVAFNPFGNFNNYVLGRVQDNIEAIGQRYFPTKAFMRASAEYNKRALPDLVQRSATMPLRAYKEVGKSQYYYDPEKPLSKYESLADEYFMMDKSADVRETTAAGADGKTVLGRLFSKAIELGYSMQDAAEYNVQTKVGMAILMNTFVRSNKTGKIVSLYDAYVYDGKTGKSTISEEYDTVIETIGKDSQGAPITREKAFNNEFRYDLRNKIREVNKQIHGNYAKVDRMVIESYSWGRLVAQFHKWVAPAFRARMQREYYDENLGWMEGRYRSALKFLRFAGERLVKGDVDFKNWNKTFLKEYGYTEGESLQMDQRATNKLMNVYRTVGEAGMILSFFLIKTLLQGMLLGDDDDDEKFNMMSLEEYDATPDSDTFTRLKNFMLYQVDRTYKEMVLFIPIIPAGLEQQYQMVKSPIASTRTLGELARAISLSLWTPIGYMTQTEEEFMNDSDLVYQRGRRAGELKVYKEWKDAVPILYAIKKWENYIDQNDFFIK